MAAVQAVRIPPDQPELVALGQLAGVAPSRMAAAFNDPEHFFGYLTLEELERLKGACERLGDVQRQMIAAMDEYTTMARTLAPEEISAVAD